eukprot:6108827-Alexandrium_andersonii.AAC.1
MLHQAVCGCVNVLLSGSSINPELLTLSSRSNNAGPSPGDAVRSAAPPGPVLEAWSVKGRGH